MKRSATYSLSKRQVKRPYRRSYIPRSMTTFRADKVALPATKFVTFQYDSVVTPITSIGQVVSLPVCLNDVNDFDRTTGNVFGNKQPLYYDTLVNNSNYTNSKVERWEVTFHIVNLGAEALQVFAVSASSAVNLFDSQSKASNLPGVKKLLLSNSSGSNNHETVTITGNISDLYSGYPGDASLSAAPNSSPAFTIFGGLTLYVPAGVVSASVSVTANLYTRLSVRTAVIS